MCKGIKLNSDLTTMYKNQLNIKDLNLIPETVKLSGKKIEGKCSLTLPWQ